MKMSKLVAAAAVVLALGACEKKSNKSQAAPPAPTVAADGTRSVPIYVKKAGYQPDKISAKPGEKLKLVFTRVEDTECGSQVKVADGALVDLPLNKPVEIAVTAPPSGQLDFICGMGMMTGVVLVEGAAPGDTRI
ncbi:MAG TPA: cupredoxin domain-containing protein [Kofleriaceae bacterium]|nr:cupredoxin domain-containing protein [Kofleriaceae bacterium]